MLPSIGLALGTLSDGCCTRKDDSGEVISGLCAGAGDFPRFDLYAIMPSTALSCDKSSSSWCGG